MKLFPDDITDQATDVLAAARAAGKTIVVAESCTGGLVTAALTEIPGSSDVFECGWAVYSNEAKIKYLGVPRDVIDTFGAVSEAVAWAMARGALEKSTADIAVAITGIAGPGGATPQKPVGTVVFAVAARGDEPNEISADRRDFGDIGRTEIRLQAVRVALELLMSRTPVEAE
jgi:nicotinamide-nucleotide amidase